jgi:adenine-specific DNA-methyltransferase
MLRSDRPYGRRHKPPKGRCWIYTEERMQQVIAGGEVWFGSDGNGVPRRKHYFSQAAPGMTPPTLWAASFAGTNAVAKREVLKLFPRHRVFDTPKPERLLSRIIEIATNPGDLAMDAYLGSGTTSAAAHKMGRSWIGIESGDHAISHCANRMRMVIDGEQGGISGEFSWSGGGGFRFERLEPQEELPRAA